MGILSDPHPSTSLLTHLVRPGQLPLRARRPAPPARPRVTPRGVADDVLGKSGFMDLARLVSGGGQQKYDAYKDLAYKIGEDMRVSMPTPCSQLWLVCQAGAQLLL